MQERLEWRKRIKSRAHSACVCSLILNGEKVECDTATSTCFHTFFPLIPIITSLLLHFFIYKRQNVQPVHKIAMYQICDLFFCYNVHQWNEHPTSVLILYFCQALFALGCMPAACVEHPGFLPKVLSVSSVTDLIGVVAGKFARKVWTMHKSIRNTRCEWQMYFEQYTVQCVIESSVNDIIDILFQTRCRIYTYRNI